MTTAGIRQAVSIASALATLLLGTGLLNLALWFGLTRLAAGDGRPAAAAAPPTTGGGSQSTALAAIAMMAIVAKRRNQR